MITSSQSDTKKTQNRALNVLRLLWKKFWQQKPLHRLVTVVVMLITILWIFVFYSTFVLWQIFSFVMTKVLLFCIEWYLQRE